MTTTDMPDTLAKAILGDPDEPAVDYWSIDASALSSDSDLVPGWLRWQAARAISYGEKWEDAGHELRPCLFCGEVVSGRAFAHHLVAVHRLLKPNPAHAREAARVVSEWLDAQPREPQPAKPPREFVPPVVTLGPSTSRILTTHRHPLGTDVLVRNDGPGTVLLQGHEFGSGLLRETPGLKPGGTLSLNCREGLWGSSMEGATVTILAIAPRSRKQAA